jgi:uncharacterized protein (DUF58 family)
VRIRRFVLPGGLAFGLLLAGLALMDGRLLALALPLLGYLLAGLVYGPSQVQLRASRAFSTDRAQEGDRVQVTLAVENEGRHLEEVLVRDRLPPRLELVEGRAAALTSLPPGGQFEFSYTVEVNRGGYPFQEIEAEASDLLGLFRRRMALPAPGQLLVLPRIAKLRSVAIRPLRTRSYAGPVPSRRGGSGVEFFGVREYHMGDPRRWINWRVSARHPSALFTNEFEQERIADVGLILDARQRSEVRVGSRSLFEHAVQATASLAGAFLDSGNRVGLLIYGRSLDWTFPGYGKVQRERIVQALAHAQTGDSQVFDRLDYLPTRLFPAQSQIVLVSPLCEEDLPALVRLRARRYQVLVIRADPVSLEVQGMTPRPEVQLAARIANLERTLLLRRLRQAGITVVDWQVEQSLDQAIYAALGRVPQWTRFVASAGVP